MKKKIFIIALMSFLFLLAQNSNAIIFTYVEGNLDAELYTGYMEWSNEWDSHYPYVGPIITDPALMDKTTGVGAYADAYGSISNGSSNVLNVTLSSTAQSSTGVTGKDFYTISYVGAYGLTWPVANILEYELTPEPGEEGMAVALTADAVLAGTLNSSGFTFLDDTKQSGISSVDFDFRVYDSGSTIDPILKISYEDSLQNDGTSGPQASVALPGHLGSKTNTDLHVGDHIWIYIIQDATAYVNGDMYASASTAIFNSSYAQITATPIPTPNAVPEPASFLLLGIGLMGLGLSDKIKKVFRM